MTYFSTQPLIPVSARSLTDYDRGQVIGTTFDNFIDKALLLSSLCSQTEVIDCEQVRLIDLL